MRRTLILLAVLLLPSVAWAQITAGSPATTASDTDDASVATGQTTSVNIGLTHVYDGSVWRRLAFGTAGTADAQVRTVQGVALMTPLLVDGSATTQPVSGTVTATATNLDVQIGGSDTVTVTDGAGAMNVIIDSGTVTTVSTVTSLSQFAGAAI